MEVSGSKANIIPMFQPFKKLCKDMHWLLPEEVIGNARRCAYSKPSPVQKYAIVVNVVRRDVMCCAHTGSGKSAALLIPVIGRMVFDHHNFAGNVDTPLERKYRRDHWVDDCICPVSPKDLIWMNTLCTSMGGAGETRTECFLKTWDYEKRNWVKQIPATRARILVPFSYLQD